MRDPDCVRHWNLRTPKTQIDNVGFIRATPFRQAARGSGSAMMRHRSRPPGKGVLAAIGRCPFALERFGAILWGVAVFAVIGPVQAQSRDPIVTSDTPQYCDVLMDRITGMTRTALVPPPTEAAVLSQEGERMCVNGQTRGGILRLRRAIAILQHGED